MRERQLGAHGNRRRVDRDPDPPHLRHALQRPLLDRFLAISLQIQLDRQDVGPHREAGIRGEELPGPLARSPVPISGLLHPSLGHGGHPEAGANEDLTELHVVAELGQRPQAVPTALLEARTLEADETGHRVPRTGDRSSPFIITRRPPAAGQPRVELVRRQPVCATDQYPLRENPVHRQPIHIPAVPVAREVVRLPRNGVEQSVRLIELR